MLPGEDACGVFPCGDTASYAAALSAVVPYDPRTDPVLLLETHPYDPVAGAEERLGFSHGASQHPEGSGPVFRGQQWWARVEALPTYEILAQLSERSVGGGSLPSFGDVKLTNGDARLDAYLAYYWAGRRFKLFSGATSLTYPQFTQRMEGLVTDATWDQDAVTLVLGSKQQELLDQPVQQNRYAGTGGREGGSDLLDRPKPLVYGDPVHVRPVLVDAPYQVYQLHDGPLRSVGTQRVYDGGAALTWAGNVADVYAWTPVGGSYVVELATGLIRLGAAPTKAVTASPLRALGTTTFAPTVTDILTRHGILMAGQIDAAALATVDAEFGAEGAWSTLNLHLTEERTIAEVLDQICTGIGALWTFNHAGQVTFRLLKLSTPTGVLAGDITKIERSRTQPPVKKLTANWGHVTPFGPDDFVGSATDTVREFLSSPSRSLVREPSAATAHALPLELTIDTPFGGFAGSNQGYRKVLDNLETLLGTFRHRYDVTVRKHAFRILPGDTWTVTHSRFGLSSGQDMLVLGVKENLADGTTELRMFG